MSLPRLVIGSLGALIALSAAGVALVGLLGALHGWPDTVNHFAPVLALAAVVGTGLCAFLAGRARVAALAVGLFGVVVFGAPVGLEWIAHFRQRPIATPDLVVLSFNRWWDNPTPEAQLRYIAASGADVVTLQEADNLDTEALRATYPHQFRCQSRCDTVILSRRPFLASGEDPAEWPYTNRWIWVRVADRRGRPAMIASVHLFWPIPPWVQARQRDHMAELVRAARDDSLVVAGDFNMSPWSWAGRRLDAALRPLTRRSHGVLTFPANPPAPVLALDEVYAGPAWTRARVRRAPDGGSDHFPLRIELAR